MHCRQRNHLTGLGTSSQTSPAGFMGVRARSMGISTVGCVAKRAEEWKKKRQRGTKRSEGIGSEKVNVFALHTGAFFLTSKQSRK